MKATGIPDEIVSKIFDPMFSTKPFGEATGLGLSVVHDIMLGDFEGTIDVKTRVGAGTTFVLRFKDPRLRQKSQHPFCAQAPLASTP